MLILVPGKEVSSLHVSPVPVVWVGGTLKHFPRMDSWWLFSVFEVSFINSASSFLTEHFSFWDNTGIQVLVVWIVGFSLSVLVSNIRGPCVFWSSPSAISLNSNVVDTSNNSEETGFTEVSTP
jgi:hypothetical protein